MTQPVFRVRPGPGNGPGHEVVGCGDEAEPAVLAFLLDLLAGSASRGLGLARLHGPRAPKVA